MRVSKWLPAVLPATVITLSALFANAEPATAALVQAVALRTSPHGDVETYLPTHEATHAVAGRRRAPAL